jgi:hypothetical protein
MAQGRAGASISMPAHLTLSNSEATQRHTKILEHMSQERYLHTVPAGLDSPSDPCLPTFGLGIHGKVLVRLKAGGRVVRACVQAVRTVLTPALCPPSVRLFITSSSEPRHGTTRADKSCPGGRDTVSSAGVELTNPERT